MPRVEAVEIVFDDALAIAKALELTSDPAVADLARQLANDLERTQKAIAEKASQRLRDEILADVTAVRDDLRTAIALRGRRRRHATQELARRCRELRSDARKSLGSPAPIGRRARMLESEKGLRNAATRYEVDARRDNRLAVGLAICSSLAVAVATGMAIMGRESAREDMSWFAIVLQLAPVIALYICAAAGFVQASRLRREVDEMRRLQRQMLTVNSYLAPLPREVQDLMRAALTQRLFPRLATDDPLRTEDWFPDGETVLAAVMPDVAREILAASAEDDEE